MIYLAMEDDEKEITPDPIIMRPLAEVLHTFPCYSGETASVYIEIADTEQ